MEFALPTDETTTTETTTDETTEALFPERDSDFEAYRATVETYRFVRKLAVSQLFPERTGGDDRVKNKEIEGLADKSPIADHFTFYKKQKNEMKRQFKDRRENGDMEKGKGLRAYKDEWPEPEYDSTHVTEENMEQYGLLPETWYDQDEGGIHVPEDYSPVTDDDGKLVVWFPGEDLDIGQDDMETLMTQFVEIAADTDGIGEKTLAALKDNLARHL